MQINKDKILSRFKVDKSHREWYEVVKLVAKFMEQSTLVGKWLIKCKGIPHETLTRWMREAEKNENEGFSKQLLFNSYKKKYHEEIHTKSRRNIYPRKGR